MSNSILARKKRSLFATGSVVTLILSSGCGFNTLDKLGKTDQRELGKASQGADASPKGGGGVTPGSSSTGSGSASADGSGVADRGTASGVDDSSDPAVPNTEPQDPNATSFKRDVLPILTAKCAECHHAGSPHTSFAAYPFSAGDMKPYVSVLLLAAKPGMGQMPPGTRDPLTAAEYGVLTKWPVDGLQK